MPSDGRTANEWQSLLPRFQFLPLPEGSYFCSPPNTQRSISGETRVKDKTGSAHMHPRARACATVTYRCNYRIVPLDDRTVDVHIGRLRKALSHGREPNPIRTVPSRAYANGQGATTLSSTVSTRCLEIQRILTKRLLLENLGPFAIFPSRSVRALHGRRRP